MKEEKIFSPTPVVSATIRITILSLPESSLVYLIFRFYKVTSIMET